MSPLPHAAAISSLYQELLGRDPDPAGAEHWAKVAQEQGLDVVREAIVGSNEYQAKLPANAGDSLAGYSSDDVLLIRGFANPAVRGEPGFVTNFLGGKVRTSSLWSSARHLDGTVTPVPPLPGDFYEPAEWAGVLKSVQEATNQFRLMELGAGFGPWVAAGGTAARRRGLQDIRVYAVEADPRHFSLLQQNMADNGFRDQEHVLLKGAVGASAGQARWPVIDDSREDWGARPTTDQDYRGMSYDRWLDVEVFGIEALLEHEPFWNLVHIDVQGSEVDICTKAIEHFNTRVRRIVVGTHSRSLDGRMVDLMWPNQWVLENERPSTFQFSRSAPTLEAMTLVDGVQVWRNSRFDH